MRIDDIIWLDTIVEKLETKHRVTPREVLEVLESRPYFCFAEKGHRRGEDVYAAYGQTETGRYLVAFFVYKERREALILSARDMSAKDRRKYERR